MQSPDYLLHLNYNELRLKVKELLDSSISPHTVKEQLIKQGYEEEAIDSALQYVMKHNSNKISKNASIVFFKDFLDKLGSGFSAPVVMFLMLHSLGAGLLFIGVVSALKNFISLLISNIIKSYSEHFSVNKGVISSFGTFFGLSFLVLAFSYSMQNKFLFTIFFLLSTAFIVLHGDFYSKYVLKRLTKVRTSSTAKVIQYFGLIFIALSLFLAGLMLDKSRIKVFGFSVPGFLLVLEIVAIISIISSYLFSFVKPFVEFKAKKNFYGLNEIKKNEFFSVYFSSTLNNFKDMFKKEHLRALFFGNLFSGSLQTVISTFAGIHVFLMNNNSYSRAVFVFAVGIAVATISPRISRSLIKIFGETPLLVFSIFLMSIFPFALYFNLSYNGIVLSNVFSVFGASNLAVVQSFLIRKKLSSDEQRIYFESTSSIIALFLPIIVIILSLIAQAYGLSIMFLCTGIAEIVLIVPFYFNLVLKDNKAHYELKV